MKIQLLNDGGYLCLSHVEFPATVNATLDDYRRAEVAIQELRKIGYKENENYFDDEETLVFTPEEYALV